MYKYCANNLPFGCSRLLRLQRAARTLNTGALGTLDCSELPFWCAMRKEDWDFAFTNDWAAKHWSKCFAVQTCRKKPLKVPPCRLLDVWGSSKMTLFRAIGDTVPYSISRVFANLRISETVFRKLWLEGQRPERLVYVGTYRIIPGWLRGSSASIVERSLIMPLHVQLAEKCSLERPWRAWLRRRSSTSYYIAVCWKRDILYCVLVSRQFKLFELKAQRIEYCTIHVNIQE